ncbi:hypothetical protein DFH27DRAFT_194856 [Peziza echinospora]|nr:hypothetical protein DFH27DRAFT_194856 [Peziza echinospora]
MLNAANTRGPTISSLITTPSHPPQQTSNVMMTAPLSASAIRISRDNRLFEHLLPKINQADRMKLLEWFLEEGSLKRYEVFKKAFYEDPDEYNYALSSLLGTLVFDVTPVPPSTGTIGTFVAPNMGRRNALFPFQSALTEKWKAIGTIFQHSWMNALNKTQRDAMIMRSFLDTANINEDMANARKQSFDIRTSELSGRGFFTFVTEHTLQPSSSQTGSIPVSLPHTDGMVRIFKEWVEKSGMPPEDDNNNNDALFKRSCALSLRDKCIYSRALFGTRLCLMVLEKWEHMIRCVEMTQNKPAKTTATIEYNPVTTVTEVESANKSAKPKKKKKTKSGKKAKKANAEGSEPVTTNERQSLENSAEVEEVEIHASDNESAVVNFTDDVKSSGVSSPTGTVEEEPHISTSTIAEMKEGTQEPILKEANATSEESNTTSPTSEAQPPVTNVAEVTLGNSTEQVEALESATPATSDKISTSTPAKIIIQNGTTLEAQNPHPAVIEASQLIVDANFPLWEDFAEPEKEPEWSHVVGKRKKNQSVDKFKAAPGGVRLPNKKITPERKQSISNIPAGQKKINNHSSGSPTKGPRSQTFNRPQVSDQEPRGMDILVAVPVISTSNISEPPIPLLSSEKSIPDTQLIAPAVSGDKDVTNGVKSLPPTSDSTADASIREIDTASVVFPIATSMDLDSVQESIPIPSNKPSLKKRIKDKCESGEFSGYKQENDTVQKSPSAEHLEAINLEYVTFFCAHCRRPRSYHSSTECALCGPRSTIRYCSTTCQRADTEHWRLCGLVPFPGPTIIPENPGTLYSLRKSPWMTRALYRQRMNLLEQHNVDYCLFQPKSGTPKYKVVFADKQLKMNFRKMISSLFENQDLNTLTIVYRAMVSHIEIHKWAFTSIELAGQLYDEFGIDPTTNPSGKDFKISMQEWAKNDRH